MIADIFSVIAAMLIILSALLGLLAAIGLLRFPDLLTRLHAVSLSGGIGGSLGFLAIVMTAHNGGIALRALLGIAFLLLTVPVSAHLLARIAHRYKRDNSVEMAIDDISTPR